MCSRNNRDLGGSVAARIGIFPIGHFGSEAKIGRLPRANEASSPTSCLADLSRLQVDRRGLSGTPVGLQVVRDFLALQEPAQTGAFERGGVNENVLAA